MTNSSAPFVTIRYSREEIERARNQSNENTDFSLIRHVPLETMYIEGAPTFTEWSKRYENERKDMRQFLYFLYELQYRRFDHQAIEDSVVREVRKAFDIDVAATNIGNLTPDEALHAMKSVDDYRKLKGEIDQFNKREAEAVRPEELVRKP